jgi:uncharacterized membrane protein (UPF0127 family)
MSDWRILSNKTTGEVILPRVRMCTTFWCHFKGLQFVRNLPADQGLLFVNGRESRSESAIHMFFMFISISVIWMDASGKVVDKTLAKPWRPMYAPRSAAQYYLEANTDVMNHVNIGDTLTFEQKTK